MGFSRQEYWSGLPFPSPEDLPDPGIEPRSPALQADSLLSELPQKVIKRNEKKREIIKYAWYPQFDLIWSLIWFYQEVLHETEYVVLDGIIGRCDKGIG